MNVFFQFLLIIITNFSLTLGTSDSSLTEGSV